jgi:hypothetical protein
MVSQLEERKHEEMMLFVQLVYWTGLWTEMTDSEVQIRASLWDDAVPIDGTRRWRYVEAQVQNAMGSGLGVL